ncbi:MAG: alpha/beta hydrolase [Gemmatimonadota bacterium]
MRIPDLHAVRSGLPPEPGVERFVLVHGFGASSFTWRHWLPTLERRGHVVSVDLLGFGGSPKPSDGPYDPVSQAALVTEAVRELGNGRVTVIGHSLGGSVALLTALALRELGQPPHRLVLLAGAAYRQRMPPFVHCARYPRAMDFGLRALGARLIVRQVVRSIVFDGSSVTDDLVEGYAAPLEQPDALPALLACAARIEPPGLDAITARYPSLTLPTLLLWGRHDRVVPPSVGIRLARTLPNARLHVLERCGHLPHEELPEASLTLLEDFLEASRFHV